MRSTWLIQRLKKPWENKAINPFCFGAGGGKLTLEAREALGEIFEFDYMGSAEFEFGRVPETLSEIFEGRESFVTDEVTIPISTIRIESWEKLHYEKLKEREGKVFLWCHKDHREYARELILSLALGDDGRKLKERSMLRYKFLKEKDGYDDRLGGWLELDNGFFFFTDRLMFENTVRFFGKEQGSTVI